MLLFSHLLHYSIIIILLYTLLPFIDFICDFISQIVIESVKILCEFITCVLKITIRFGLYYFMATIYIFWSALIVGVIVDLLHIKN